MRVINMDITKVDVGVLINGVNCQDAMGSGVARAYFEKWPQVKQQYHVWTKDKMHLGKFDPVIIEHDRLYVANCWTQEYFGSDGGVYADYGAIIASVTQAVLFARAKSLPVYTPWVGCGLGGLEEKQVAIILREIEYYTGHKITVCEL